MPRYQTTAQGRRVEPGDTEYNWDQESTAFDPVADAQSFLSDQSQSRAPWTAGGQENIAEEIRRMPPSAPPPMSLRGLTDIGESVALPLAGMGMIPSPMSPLLLGASAFASGAGGLRKLIAPDEDESRVGGAIQTGLSALPVAGAAMRGLGKIGQVATKRFPVSSEKAYRMGEATQTSGLNEQPQSIQALLDMVSGSTPPKAPASATASLPESWKQFASTVTPKGTKSPPKSARTPLGAKGRLSRMEQESGAGYRNVPSESDNPMLDALPEGGLGTVTPAEWSRLGLRQVRQDIPAHMDDIDGGAGFGEDLLAGLSRLKIPTRARAFRENTPFPE